MEVEADEVGLEEHEEVVLEPRNTMSVHHRIYLPSLVHVRCPLPPYQRPTPSQRR